MPSIINPVITDAGLNAAINAASNGLKLEITHIALGTGRYDPALMAPSMVSMAGLKEAVTIGAGTSAGTGSFTLAVRFESWTGTPNPYDATEVGFFAGDPAAGGILFAVHSHPSQTVVQRNALDYVASFTLQLTRVPAGSVSVVINPDGPQMMALLNLHLNATDPHSQYLRRTGDTATGHIKGLTAGKNDNSKNFATTEHVLGVGLNFPTSGIVGVTGNAALTPAHSGCVIDAQASGIVITLPRSADCRIGATITVRSSVAACSVAPASGDFLMSFGFGQESLCQLARGDTMSFIRNEAGNWYPIGGSGAVPVGSTTFVLGESAPPGWLKMNGSALSRASYPALWRFAQGTGVVSEAQWWNQGYFGRFSSGAAQGTFRLPDARGMFLRALDEGRGYDGGRAWGSFQDQSNMSHDHGVYDPGHTHGVYDPQHNHYGVTAADGTHQHQLNTNGVGAGRVGPDEGALHSGTGKISSWTTLNGAHQHTFWSHHAATGIGIHGAGTNLSIQASGGEARPRNLSMILCIKH